MYSLWNRIRPRALIQNQHIREIINARKMPNKHNKEDPSHYCNSPGMPLVEFMYLVFTHMPGKSCCRWLRSSLLCLCDIFWALINSLVCCISLWQKNNNKKIGNYLLNSPWASREGDKGIGVSFVAVFLAESLWPELLNIVETCRTLNWNAKRL